MGQYLWQLTGIEPFSVEQTQYYQRGKDNALPKLYRHLMRSKHFNGPVALVDRRTSSFFTNWKGNIDMQVFLPPIHGSPSVVWRSGLPSFQKVVLKHDCPAGLRCLVKLNPVDDPDDAVPVALEIRRGSRFEVFIPPGRYKVTFKTEAGSSSTSTISVQ
jgi:hypothetical protein